MSEYINKYSYSCPNILVKAILRKIIGLSSISIMMKHKHRLNIILNVHTHVHFYNIHVI
jgi:hypothetical protein